MTDAELNTLEAAAKAATPGPWEAWNSGEPFLVVKKNVSDYDVDVIAESRQEDIVDGMANAAYIAAANPAVVLNLIAELRQAKAERDWLAKEVATITGSKSNKWLQAAKDATCQKN